MPELGVCNCEVGWPISLNVLMDHASSYLCSNLKNSMVREHERKL